MRQKRMFHWYTIYPYARRSNILSLRLIREEYDRIYRSMADYTHGVPTANTPLVYALVKRSDEHVFAEAQARALRSGDIRYLEAGNLPQILAIAEERMLEVSNQTETRPLSTTSRGSVALSLERRGSICDGWDDTLKAICTSGTLAGMMCDCSKGIPELAPIVFNYQAPASAHGSGYLTDVTTLTKLLYRASSL